MSTTATSAAAQRITVLGLGRMGAPIATRLARAGFLVIAYDPRPEAATAALASAGVVCADSPVAAVHGADIVVTVLPGTPELRALMIDDGLLNRLGRATVWIDCTSTAPDVGEELTTRASRAGVTRVDCALGGGPDDAAAGTLTLYVGGSDDALRRCGAVTDIIAASGRVHHVGTTGSGTLAKLLVNLLWFGQATLVGEALLLAAAAGLDAACVAELLPATPAASAFVRDHLPGLLTGDYLASFGLDRVVEELDGLERLAHTRDSPFAVGSAVSRIHRQALERFGATDGELLAVAHLEALAHRSLSDTRNRP